MTGRTPILFLVDNFVVLSLCLDGVAPIPLPACGPSTTLTMEFDSPADFTTVAAVPAKLDLSLEELDAILEVDVVNTVPPLTNN